MSLYTQRVPIGTDGSQFRIVVNIEDRGHRLGYLKVYDNDGSLLISNIKCRAQGNYYSGTDKSTDNNYLCWNEFNGNTPYGQWLGEIYAAKSDYDVGSRCPEDTGSYGPHKRIWLKSAYNGYAQEALANGRSGFMIHGGRWCANNIASHLSDSNFTYNGETFKLWNTSGCIRLSNSDQELLIDTLANVGYGLGTLCLVDVNWIFDTSDLPTS